MILRSTESTENQFHLKFWSSTFDFQMKGAMAAILGHGDVERAQPEVQAAGVAAHPDSFRSVVTSERRW